MLRRVCLAFVALILAARRTVSFGMLQERSFEGCYNVKHYLSYFREVRQNTPRTQEIFRDHFTAIAKQAGSQWRVMSETEKAVRVTLMAMWMTRSLVLGADRNTMIQQRPRKPFGVKNVTRRVMLSSNGRSISAGERRMADTRSPRAPPFFTILIEHSV